MCIRDRSCPLLIAAYTDKKSIRKPRSSGLQKHNLPARTPETPWRQPLDVYKRQYYDCDRCIVMTNGTFTKAAISAANKLDVKLWDNCSMLKSTSPVSYTHLLFL